MAQFASMAFLLGFWACGGGCCPSPPRELLIRLDAVLADAPISECMETSARMVGIGVFTRHGSPWCGLSGILPIDGNHGQICISQAPDEPKVFSIGIRLPSAGASAEQLVQAQRRLEDVAQVVFSKCSTEIVASSCRHYARDGVRLCPGTGSAWPMHNLSNMSPDGYTAHDRDDGDDDGPIDKR